MIAPLMNLQQLCLDVSAPHNDTSLTADKNIPELTELLLWRCAAARHQARPWCIILLFLTDSSSAHYKYKRGATSLQDILCILRLSAR